MTRTSDRIAPAFLVFSHIVLDDIYVAVSPLAIDRSVLSLGMLGGAGSYAAVGAAIASPSPVGLVSGVGADFPTLQRDLLEQSGISCDGLIVTDPFTPRTRIDYFPDGERSEKPLFGMEHFARADPAIAGMIESFERPRGAYVFDTVHPEFWVDLALLKAKTGCAVLWEINADACTPEQLPAVLDQLATVDILSINRYELTRLMSLETDAADDALFATLPLLLDSGATAVVLRLGAAGAVVHTRAGIWSSRPAPAEVVDPTGGGNAFSGAFLVGWVESGGAPDAALRSGMVAAASTIAQFGPPLPVTPASRARFTRSLTRVTTAHNPATQTVQQNGTPT